ncbi:hypothetical protein [Fusobacterium sp. THCT1E2]
MIEKIIKAVKRGNKKRSINITIGAVVGFLLSCTAVMGEDNYLWIKNDSGTIKFSTDNGISLDVDNPYDENTWNGIEYINNITLSGTNNLTASEGHGLKLSGDLGSFNFINNGVIAGTGDDFGYGIFNDGSIGTLTNIGLITVESESDSNGIYSDSTIKVLANNGLIVAKSTNNGYGIYNDFDDASIENLINRGLIIGYGYDESSGIYNCVSIENLINRGLIMGYDYGIVNVGVAVIEILTNRGLITGNRTGIDNYGSIEILTNGGLITGTSAGIYNVVGIYNVGSIETLTNAGIVYGKNYAISNYGDINSAYNYGILANGVDNSVLNGLTAVDVLPDDTDSRKNKILNRGLIFTALGTGVYKAAEDDYKKFGKIYKEEKYTVINAKEKEGSNESNITGTESLSLDKGVLTCGNSEKINISSDKKYILNGITDTLKVAGTGNELNNSAVNAYKTAVVMDKVEEF